jgi:transcriptional regulator with XRE-family HTH domain
MDKPLPFASILRNERKTKKITLRELSEKIGISYSSLGKYERGEYEPDIKTIIKLSSFFDVSVDYLLGLTPIKNYKTIGTLYDKNLINSIDQLDIDPAIKEGVEKFIFKSTSLMLPYLNNDNIKSDRLLYFSTELMDILYYIQREAIIIHNKLSADKHYSSFDAYKDLKIFFYDSKEEINEILFTMLEEYIRIYIDNTEK